MSMVKEHQSKQVVKKENQGKFSHILYALQKIIQICDEFFVEIKRKGACAAANLMTQALVDHLNVGWDLYSYINLTMLFLFENIFDFSFSFKLFVKISLFQFQGGTSLPESKKIGC